MRSEIWRCINYQKANNSVHNVLVVQAKFQQGMQFSFHLKLSVQYVFEIQWQNDKLKNNLHTELCQPQNRVVTTVIKTRTNKPEYYGIQSYVDKRLVLHTTYYQKESGKKNIKRRIINSFYDTQLPEIYLKIMQACPISPGNRSRTHTPLASQPGTNPPSRTCLGLGLGLGRRLPPAACVAPE